MTDPKKQKIELTEKTRYSDEELEEFEQIIITKLEKAKEDLKMLMEAYTLDGEHGTDDTSPTFKILEEGYQVMSKEENSRLASRQQKFINNLENALRLHLAGLPVSEPLTNPIGCNVKWKGMDAHWMPAEACDLVFPPK